MEPGQPCPGGGSIDQHAARCDVTGKLVSWAPVTFHDYAYDWILALSNNWFLALPNVTLAPSAGATSGLVQKPAYYGHSYLCSGVDPGCGTPGGPSYWPHNPAGLYAMGVESALAYSAYLGSTQTLGVVLGLLDWHLAHGMTLPTDAWASVPYASGPSGVYNYRGATMSPVYGVGAADGDGYLEPDKVGALGWGFAQAFRYNGNTGYRDAAVRAANQLAQKIRVPTASISPWPFRARASDGAVRSGSGITDDYCANVIEPIKLFDALIALANAGALDGAPGYDAAKKAAWQSARATAVAWLLGPSGPIATAKWEQYFEDVSSAPSAQPNKNQLVAGETAKWLMDHPADDPQWRTHVETILAFIEAEFGATPEYGATPIREQKEFFYRMASHTARYGAVNARYAELTANAVAREKAFRAFNWATYMVRSSGMTLDGPYPANVWFTDGWFDFQRHFMIGMGAVPDWAPHGQSHFLRTTSLVRSISYSPTEILYQTADAAATDVLRLSFVPTEVTAGGVALPKLGTLGAGQGWSFETQTDQFGHPRNVLRVKHDQSGVVYVR